MSYGLSFQAESVSVGPAGAAESRLVLPQGRPKSRLVHRPSEGIRQPWTGSRRKIADDPTGVKNPSGPASP